jgi:hypothetical protein
MARLALSPTEIEKKKMMYQPHRCTPLHFLDPVLKIGRRCSTNCASTPASISSTSEEVK